MNWPKSIAFFFRKNCGPMMSKQLQNIIGISAMDKLVIIIMWLTNNPGSRGHRNKGSNSKQGDFGKLASPSNCLFGVVFKFGLCLRETFWFAWKSPKISCLSLLICAIFASANTSSKAWGSFKTGLLSTTSKRVWLKYHNRFVSNRPTAVRGPQPR